MRSGFAARIRVRVPWHALSTEPITVELHDLFVLLSEDQHSARRHVAEEIKRTKLAVSTGRSVPMKLCRPHL